MPVPRPLNIPLVLDDGRQLIVKHGGGQHMVCRQKTGEPLTVGDAVRTVNGDDGRKAAMVVIKRTRRDVHFRIIGSCDGDSRSNLRVAEVRALWYRLLKWLGLR